MKMIILGCGGRISEIIRECYKWSFDKLEIAGIVDPDKKRALERIAPFYKKPEPPFFDSAKEAIEATNPDGVFIGTRCNLHTDYALEVMSYNIPMFIEKPVSINKEQALRLNAGMKKYKAQAVCSFPLRVSPIIQSAKEIIAAGKLGTVEHVQAVNNVSYGGIYYHAWYRDESVTGGLWMQKATHDFDYIMDLVGTAPVSVCAMDSKQIFKGDKPAGLRCGDCEENGYCPECWFVMHHEKMDNSYGDGCCFAADTGNHDSGSAILRFPSGMHAVYSQNFIVRKSAGRRGARLVGYKGTMEFNWNERELKFMSHSSSKIETHKLDTSGMGHAGGDMMLARNFLEVCNGKDSVSPLLAGVLSAWVCLHAEESSRTNKFIDIPAL